MTMACHFWQREVMSLLKEGVKEQTRTLSIGLICLRGILCDVEEEKTDLRWRDSKDQRLA
jgi:hypothetical protein